MAWTNVGYDGTINEAQWASLSGLLGNGYVAAGNGDCVVTAVPGARSVSVAAGTLYGDGVSSTNSGPETVAMTTPTNGQWFIIALRRTWATNTAALVAIAGATTTTSLPTAPPTSFPTLNTNQGVLTDQPIAWAWCNSANTDVVVVDLRQFPVRTQTTTGNAIINGNMDIWQRGTSFSGAGLLYSADRWTYWRDGYASGITASQQLAGLPNSKYCLRIQRNSGNTGTGILYTNQPITNDDSLPLIGKTVTLSGWVRKGTNFSGTGVNMLVRSGTGTDQPVNNMTGATTVATTTLSVSTAWQRFSITGNVSASATQLGVEFNYTPTGTAGTNDYFEVTGVQLEASSTATPFKRAGGTLAGELAACQRYYWRWSASGDEPGVALGIFVNSTTARIYLSLPVEMRTTPWQLGQSNLYVSDQVTASGVLTAFSYISSRSTSKTIHILAGQSGFTFPTRIPAALIGHPSGTASFLEVNAEL